VTVKTPDGNCDAVLFHPQGAGNWPAVLIWPDIMGCVPLTATWAAAWPPKAIPCWCPIPSTARRMRR
jgi:dienelactone hydrolase